MRDFSWFLAAGVLAVMAGCSAHTGAREEAAGGDGADGGASGGSNGSAPGADHTVAGDGEGTPCPTAGQMRTCCSNAGHQKCVGDSEFTWWGPCVADNGKQVVCETHTDCSSSEFGPDCVSDGGLPPAPPLCSDRKVNNEPEILAGYSPAANESVGQDGQIKVWITDEWPTVIAPGEQVDLSTGQITAPGDRTAKATDGYLRGPALYIAPLTVESGGQPHFPQYVKGWFNNGASSGGGGKPMMMHMAASSAVQGAPVDAPPAGVKLSEKYSSEFIWDVRELGLKPGTYYGEFVVPDGDDDRAIGCVTITITN